MEKEILVALILLAILVALIMLTEFSRKWRRGRGEESINRAEKDD